MRFSRLRLVPSAALFALLLALARPLWAGPPFITDDPDPVPYQHWEVYLASTGLRAADGWSGTLPHIEVNYGAAPGLQLHIIAPMVAAQTAGAPRQYGYGDTELGAKVRFVKEGQFGKDTPEIGVFPLVEVPTGDAARGLGAGYTQVFIPMWVQKSWGPDQHWTSYGGAGFWRNPGPGNRNWNFAGWELQRDFSKTLTLGGEAFHETADTLGAKGGFGFNLGGIVNFTDHRHLLFSLGRNGQQDHGLLWYAAYQWTF